MLKEFAVNPSVIALSYETCRYLISQFGADKGRLISRFPKSWKRLAYDAADKLPDGRKKEQVIEYLNNINNDWLVLIPSNRPFEMPGSSWLDNAIAAHRKKPFHAIVCDRDDPPNRLIDISMCDERNPLFAAKRISPIKRTANDLALAAFPLLQNCRTLRLVDPYFNPGRPKWRNPLAAFLACIPDISRVVCEYHLLERDRSPPTSKLIQRLQQLQTVIPAGGTLRIIRWRERDGGERFHRRYLLTENAGLYYEGGLDQETQADQTTDVSLLDRDLHQQRWNEYDMKARVYELFEPVLVVDSSGNVTEE